VTIVAVTKTHGPEAIIAAYKVGLGDVGENRVQEAVAKIDAVSAPVRWHLIGHLQRNKVKSLDRFALFHALDSARLADAVSTFGAERGKPIDALLQVNVAGEETKGGFSRAELDEHMPRLTSLDGLKIRGVMTMARLGADEAELRRTFAGARDALAVVKGAGHPATELSMGMSNDYEIAVEEGATMVRLGTTLFGARE
jgi:pyridoxal phosphate enzyme (YggS family)